MILRDLRRTKSAFTMSIYFLVLMVNHIPVAQTILKTGLTDTIKEMSPQLKIDCLLNSFPILHFKTNALHLILRNISNQEVEGHF
jgi:hypothetical protein